MSVLLLIAGLILLLAIPGVFTGAATVGLILAIVGGLWLLLQVLWTVFVGSVVKKQWERF